MKIGWIGKSEHSLSYFQEGELKDLQARADQSERRIVTLTSRLHVSGEYNHILRLFPA